MLIVPNLVNYGTFLVPETDLEELEVWARENEVTYYAEPVVLGWWQLSVGVNKELFVLRWV